MPRLEDHERVQIPMGELRRLQKADREVKKYKQRNMDLENTFKRIKTMARETISLIDKMEDTDGTNSSGEKKGVEQGKGETRDGKKDTHRGKTG